MLLSSKPSHHPRTAARVFDKEAVIISPAENVVRMLNPTGSRIWELADGTHTLEHIAQVLSHEFDVDPDHARASVVAFVSELLARELVVLDGEAATEEAR